MFTVQKTLVILCLVFCLLGKSKIVSGKAIVENCKSLETEKILEGCSTFKGLSIKSQGGTVVNATNCDVLLPKKVFEKEPGINLPTARDVSLCKTFKFLIVLFIYKKMLLFLKLLEWSFKWVFRCRKMFFPNRNIFEFILLLRLEVYFYFNLLIYNLNRKSKLKPHLF